VCVLPAAAAIAVLVAACAATSTAPVVDRPIREEPDYAVPKTQPPELAKPAASPAPTRQPAAPEQGTHQQASTGPDGRPDSYVVKKGDTLYSIALDHGLAYRDLASWNGLTDPNVIRVGQTLRVTPPPGWKEEDEEPPQVIARPVAPAPTLEGQPLDEPKPPPLKSEPKAVKVAYSDQALARLRGEKEPAATTAPSRPAAVAQAPAPPAPKPSPPSAPAKPTATPGSAQRPSPPALPATVPVVSEVDGIAWSWPARGKLLHAYNQGPNPKGMAIGGEEGQPITASAPGKVVYAGSGLRGYGKLVIIKHNSTYLSVYAHNRALLVKEGDRVGAGQKIAEMGNTDSDRVELHFEIRRLGKPVDPLRYLPHEGAG
jgi:lipoprotein NlpD